MIPLGRSPRIREINKETHVNNDQITITKPTVSQESNIKRHRENPLIGQTREANRRRTQPHLFSQQGGWQINFDGATSMSHQADCSGINPTQRSNQIHDHFVPCPASSGSSSFRPENQYAGVVPREGKTTAYLYYPLLSPSAPNTSAPSISHSKEGTPMVQDISSEQLRQLIEDNSSSGSNPRAGSHRPNHQLSARPNHQLSARPNHQLSSFCPVAPLPHTSCSNRNYVSHQQPAQYQCNQPVRNVQTPLPSYWNSAITNNNTNQLARNVRPPLPSYWASDITTNNTSQPATNVQPPLPSYWSSEITNNTTNQPATNVQPPLPSYWSSGIAANNTNQPARKVQPPLPSFWRSDITNNTTSQPARNIQPPLPSYWSSEITTTNTSQPERKVQSPLPTYWSSEITNNTSNQPARTVQPLLRSYQQHQPAIKDTTTNNSQPARTVQPLLRSYQQHQPAIKDTTTNNSQPARKVQSPLPSYWSSEIIKNTTSRPERNAQPPLPSYWSSEITNTTTNQPTRNVQSPLLSYLSSKITTNNTSNAGTSQSILGNNPAAAGGSFQPPPLDADDMAATARGPQCSLGTVDLLSLVESLGTPKFMANSERVLGSGSSLYEPRRADAATPAHFPAMRSKAVPEPSIVLGLKDGNGDEKGEGNDVWSYWNSSAMARTMERVRRRETTTQTSPALPAKTLDLNKPAP